MKRHPRAGLRDRWVDALLEADVSKPTLLLMLVLAHRMGDHGKVQMRRQEMADLLRVHPQRIAERIKEARTAGLLDIVEGTGVRGRVAQYVAVLPDCVPDSGTHSGGIRYGSAVRTFGTHSGVETGGYVPESGTHNTRASVEDTAQRTDHERNVGASPCEEVISPCRPSAQRSVKAVPHSATQRRSDRRAPKDSSPSLSPVRPAHRAPDADMLAASGADVLDLLDHNDRSTA